MAVKKPKYRLEYDWLFSTGWKHIICRSVSLSYVLRQQKNYQNDGRIKNLVIFEKVDGSDWRLYEKESNLS